MRKKKRKKKRKLTRHHNINRCRGGKCTPENIIMLKNEKHQCWHEIFGNLTFAEAGRLLLRVSKMKGGSNG